MIMENYTPIFSYDVKTCMYSVYYKEYPRAIAVRFTKNEAEDALKCLVKMMIAVEEEKRNTLPPVTH